MGDMDPGLFPWIVGGAFALIMLFDKIPRSIREAMGGFVLIAVVLASVVEGVRAFLR